MATFCSPPITPDDDDPAKWITLGDWVAEWIERNAVFGPGSRFGELFQVDDEFYAWLCRAYQVYPANHALAGRRRFGTCWMEAAKGTGKTEKALCVAQVEFHHTGPVRVAGWTGGRRPRPIPGPVPYPRLFFLGVSGDHVERTAWGRFRKCIEVSPLAEDYHNTGDKIMLLGPDGVRGAPLGEAMPLPISPSALDGDLPTWQHIDEPHRYTFKRHHDAVEVIEQNAMKDEGADAWMLATSTAGKPGGGSVLEAVKDAAEAKEVARAEGRPPLTDRSFFYRRFATEVGPDGHPMPIETVEQAKALVAEARGASGLGNLQAVAENYFDAKTDRDYWVRVWLGWWRKANLQAFNLAAWQAKAEPREVPARSFIAVGFDGAVARDSTAIVATDIPTGYQWVAGIWERPYELDEGAEWRVPEAEVDATLADLFDRHTVWRLYMDPPYWEGWRTVWQARWGEERVIEWWTNRDRAMASALRQYALAITSTPGLTHDGNHRMAAHIGNATKKYVAARDSEDQPMWVIRKDRPSSPRKIDGAMAGALSWEARSDAIASGARAPVRRGAPVRIR